MTLEFNCDRIFALLKGELIMDWFMELELSINTMLLPAIRNLKDTILASGKENAELKADIISLEKTLMEIKPLSAAISNQVTLEAIKLLIAHGNPDPAQMQEYMKTVRMIFTGQNKNFSTSTPKVPIAPTTMQDVVSAGVKQSGDLLFSNTPQSFVISNVTPIDGPQHVMH